MVDEALLEVGEILITEADNRVELVGPVPVGILGAVRDRCVEHAAISRARPAAHRTRFDNHYSAARCSGQGVDRRPQPGESAANDDEIGVDLPAQPLRAIWGIRAIGPEHLGTRGRQCRRR